MLFLLLDLLRARVGGPIVVSHLAADLQVAPKTILHWIEILEKMYLIFIVKPYTKNLPRAIQKPFKVYFFDNAEVIGNPGACFENFIAAQLLKKIQFEEDRSGYCYELCYVRDKEGHEVDVVVVKERLVEALVEAKWSDKGVSQSHAYFSEKLQPTYAFQMVAHLKNTYSKGKLQVVSVLDAFYLK